MSKKAPDTRNRLDNNRNSKPKSKPQRFTQTELRENIKKVQEEVPLKIKAEKKPSKGSMFKKANGFSKTQKRSLRKHDLVSQGLKGLEMLKEITKKRKLKEKKERQNKHQISATYKRLNGKKRTVKQGKKSKSSKISEVSRDKKKK